MDRSAALKYISGSLLAVYDESEALLIAKYYLSDTFGNDAIIADVSKLESDLQKLKQAVPLQYATGKAYFYAHSFEDNEYS